MMDDYADIGFDITPHREAITAFAALDLRRESYRPALKVRDAVVKRFPGQPFHISVSRGAAVSGSEILHQADTETQAHEIRADVERYFLRHFPGRYRVGSEPGHGSYVLLLLDTPPQPPQNE